MANLTTDLPENDDLITHDNSVWVNQKEALERLENKSYYKDLFETGYFRDYVFSLVMTLLDRDVVENSGRSAVIEKLVGVAKLYDYFMMVKSLGSTGDEYDATYDEMEQKEFARLEKVNNALEQISNDIDFKLLIQDSYLKDYAVSQTSLIVNDSIMQEGTRAQVLEALAGISTLGNYMVDIQKEYGYMLNAAQEIEEDEG